MPSVCPSHIPCASPRAGSDISPGPLPKVTAFATGRCAPGLGATMTSPPGPPTWTMGAPFVSNPTRLPGPDNCTQVVMVLACMSNRCNEKGAPGGSDADPVPQAAPGFTN